MTFSAACSHGLIQLDPKLYTLPQTLVELRENLAEEQRLCSEEQFVCWKQARSLLYPIVCCFAPVTPATSAAAAVARRCGAKAVKSAPDSAASRMHSWRVRAQMTTVH